MNYLVLETFNESYSLLVEGDKVFTTPYISEALLKASQIQEGIVITDKSLLHTEAKNSDVCLYLGEMHSNILYALAKELSKYIDITKIVVKGDTLCPGSTYWICPYFDINSTTIEKDYKIIIF